VHARDEDHRGADLRLLDEISADLAEVQAALDRLDDGAYGRCERCGGVIDAAELEASPTARFCAAHDEGDAGAESSEDPA
jgi:RNA polymerase-binding transcription factor DksA